MKKQIYFSLSILLLIGAIVFLTNFSSSSNLNAKAKSAKIAKQNPCGDCAYFKQQVENTYNNVPTWQRRNAVARTVIGMIEMACENNCPTFDPCGLRAWVI